MVLKSVPIPRPKPAETQFGKLCQTIFSHPKFEPFIYASIIFNVLILCLKWEGISLQLLDFFEKVNILFTGIFVVEAVVKITGIGGQYFIDYWNIFDFFVTILSCITIVLDGLGTVQLGGSMMVIRSFRISKVLRLIKKTKSLRHIFKTFIQCLKPLTNIGSLLLLILYMYTIAGVILFGQVKRNGKLTDTLNFESFGNGALALFVVSTTDAWTEIAQSCLKRQSVDFDCIPSPTYDDYIQNGRQTVGCGAKFSGILYFYSFFLVMGLILLKLFVAIICQAYEDIKGQEERSFNDEAIEQFNQVWQKYHDENYMIFIPIFKLRDFFTELNDVPNFNGKLFWRSGDSKNIKQAQKEYIRDLKFNVYNSFSSYLYYEILDCVAQKLIMHDYAMEARKEEAEQLSMIQRDESANNETVSPDEPKTPGNFKMDFSPITTPMDEDEQVKSPEEIAIERDLLKLEEECKELYVDFIEKINQMLKTQGGKVIAIKEINNMRENLMFMHSLSELQEKIGECDQHNPEKIHFHAMTSKHLFLADKIFQQMKLFVELKKNPVQKVENQADQYSDESSQNQVAKSDVSEHQKSLNGDDSSQNTSYLLDDGTDTKQHHENEHEEKPQELIVKLLQMSMKLKIDTDVALANKSPVKWERLKKSVLRGVSETSPLRLQLQACREPEPPKDVMEIKDSDSIHPCLFKAMNQAKEQLGWHLFDPLECTVQSKRERLRSAGPKKSQVIETQAIPQRPQSARRPQPHYHQAEEGTQLADAKPIILFQSPAKRQSMLQNFINESPMMVNAHCPDDQHLFKFRSAGKHERNRRIQGNFSIKDSESAIQVKSATFSIGKKTFNSPSPFKYQ